MRPHRQVMAHTVGWPVFSLTLAIPYNSKGYAATEEE
jgi:hypothetical protein